MNALAVLGVDPSLRGLAFALGVEGLPVHEGRGKSKPAPGIDGRLHRYREMVAPVVEVARQYQPRVVLLEGYSYGSTGRATLDLAELGGILRDRVRPHCELMLEIAPATLKLFATGKGGFGAYPKGLTDEQKAEQKRKRREESKGSVMRGLADLYGREFANDDQADAYALLRIGMCLVGMDSPMTNAQRDVIASLRQKAEAA